MPRKKTGRIEVRAASDGSERYIARLGKEYLGTELTRVAAQGLIDVALEDEQTNAHKRSVAVLGEEYMAQLEYLERLRRGNGYNTCKTLWPLWKRHVRTAAWYRKRVERVTRDELIDWINGIVGQPAVRLDRHTMEHVPTGEIVGTSTGVRLRGLLRRFFSQCKGVRHNPAADLPLPNVHRVKRKADGDKIPHLHLDEIDRLYALPADVFTPMHRAVYACGIYGGLRTGEIIGLRWADVRLGGDKPQLAVRNSYAAATKNESSQREIALLPQLARELRAYRDSLPAAPLLGLVFPNQDGGMRHHGWSAQWADRSGRQRNGARWQTTRGLRTLAKVRAHIQFRHIRHSCATHLLSGAYFSTGHEWPVEKVSQLLGHTSVAMTLSKYAARGVERLHAELARSVHEKATRS